MIRRILSLCFLSRVLAFLLVSGVAFADGALTPIPGGTTKVTVLKATGNGNGPGSLPSCNVANKGLRMDGSGQAFICDGSTWTSLVTNNVSKYQDGACTFNAATTSAYCTGIMLAAAPSLTGSGTVPAGYNDADKYQFAMKVGTSVTINTTGGINIGNALARMPILKPVWNFAFYTDAVSVAKSRYCWVIGGSNASTDCNVTGTGSNYFTSNNDHVGLIYNPDNGTHFQLCASNGSAFSCTDTGITPTVDTLYQVSLDYSGAPTTLTVTINGATTTFGGATLPNTAIGNANGRTWFSAAVGTTEAVQHFMWIKPFTIRTATP